MANIRIFIFLAFILITFIKSDLEYSCEQTGTPSDKNECFGRISEDEKWKGWHCCYATRTPRTRRVSGSTVVSGSARVFRSTSDSGSGHPGGSTSQHGSAATSPTAAVVNICELLDEDKYNDINSYAQELQSGKAYTASLECYQKYVTLNLLFLIILFYF